MYIRVQRFFYNSDSMGIQEPGDFETVFNFFLSHLFFDDSDLKIKINQKKVVY